MTKREIKIKLIAIRWFRGGLTETLATARRVLDSLDDAEIDEEFAKVPRMVNVRPWLDRYEQQITKEKKR